jgi:hypothetical protein
LIPSTYKKVDKLMGEREYKKILEDSAWHDSGYICPYCAEKVIELDLPFPIETVIYRCLNDHRFSHKLMTDIEKQALKDKEKQDILNIALVAKKAEQKLVGKKLVENARAP